MTNRQWSGNSTVVHDRRNVYCLECERGHWRLQEYAGAADLREVMRTAERCDDYDEVREGE